MSYIPLSSEDKTVPQGFLFKSYRDPSKKESEYRYHMIATPQTDSMEGVKLLPLENTAHFDLADLLVNPGRTEDGVRRFKEFFHLGENRPSKVVPKAPPFAESVLSVIHHWHPAASTSNQVTVSQASTSRGGGSGPYEVRMRMSKDQRAELTCDTLEECATLIENKQTEGDRGPKEWSIKFMYSGTYVVFESIEGTRKKLSQMREEITGKCESADLLG